MNKTNYQKKLEKLPVTLNQETPPLYLSMYYRLENIKKLYKTINSQISDPNWNEEFELAYGSYSVSDIQSYIECFIKNMKSVW